MSARFTITDTAIDGVKVVRRLRLGDARGSFERIFCAEELAGLGWTGPVVQVNRTRTAKAGTVRGMHFQRPPSAEQKLVSCTRGQVFDVAVDLRAGSPTYLRWHAEILSDDNATSMLIPEGCAHGIQTLTEDVELIYVHSFGYRADDEGGLHPLDPAIAVAWPLPVVELSARDQSHPPITRSFVGMTP